MQRLPSLVRRRLGVGIHPESRCVNALGGSNYKKSLLMGINPSRCALFSLYIINYTSGNSRAFAFCPANIPPIPPDA